MRIPFFTQFNISTFFTQFKEHEALHTKYSGFISCHICLYQMNDNETLKAHIEKHAQAKPKECVICNEEKPRLRLHVQTRVSTDPGA